MYAADPLSLRRRALPVRFARRRVTVPAGEALRYVDAAWRDALVIVERGTVELECSGGARHTFGRGDILCVEQLGLRVIRNVGTGPAVLCAVTRRGTC